MKGWASRSTRKGRAEQILDPLAHKLHQSHPETHSSRDGRDHGPSSHCLDPAIADRIPMKRPHFRSASLGSGRRGRHQGTHERLEAFVLPDMSTWWEQLTRFQAQVLGPDGKPAADSRDDASFQSGRRVCGGKAAIDNTRIRVNNVVWLHKEGLTPPQILEPIQISASLRSTQPSPTTTTM
jgi:hypothetical protein